jgi:hypothetical protein
MGECLEIPGKMIDSNEEKDAEVLTYTDLLYWPSN